MLADKARAEAAGWSEPHPWNMRAAVGSAHAANSLRGSGGATYDFGDSDPQYVVALDGHFACRPPACAGGSAAGQARPQPSPSTTGQQVVPVSTMVFTVQITAGAGDGVFSVVNHEVDMTRLGKVYLLDGYP